MDHPVHSSWRGDHAIAAVERGADGREAPRGNREKEGWEALWTIIIIIHAGVLQMLSFDRGLSEIGKVAEIEEEGKCRWTKWVSGTVARSISPGYKREKAEGRVTDETKRGRRREWFLNGIVMRVSALFLLLCTLSRIASSSSSPSLSPISCSSLIPHPYSYILGRSFYPLDLPLCHSTTTLLFPFSLYSGRAHIVQWTTLWIPIGKESTHSYV